MNLHRRTVLTLLLGSWLFSVWCSPCSAQEWLQLRGDRQMTGRASGTGWMLAQPQLGWSLDISAWKGYLSLDRQQTANQVSLPYQTNVDPGYYSNNLTRWGLSAPLYDLYGNGNPIYVPTSSNVRVVKVLQGVEGLQKFVYEDTFAGIDPARGYLYAYDTGSERLVWSTEAYSTMYAPQVVFTDADDDGLMDVVVTSWGRIVVFDGTAKR